MAQQLRILYRGYGVHFGVGFAAAVVVTFADDTSVVHYHGANHRIRGGVAGCLMRKLQTAEHV